jgi:hypothetical protein
VDHPASRIISDMNERTTWSRVRNNSHFAHAAFVATFEPKDIGHATTWKTGFGNGRRSPLVTGNVPITDQVLQISQER